MIYRFLLLSDEVESFKREITIDSEATFSDLHHAILDSVGYTKDQMTSFFICADDWSKLTEITLVEMDTSSEEDSYIMEKTHLNEALEEEKQKLIYVFEYLTERSFFMELREIVPGKTQKNAICIKSVGEPPVQMTDMEDVEPATTSRQPSGIEENFYGDEEFDLDELDKEGFDGLGDSVNPYEDTF